LFKNPTGKQARFPCRYWVCPNFPQNQNSENRANPQKIKAYLRLTGRASKEEEIKAIRVMTRWGRGVNLPGGVGAYRFLAQATGLSKQRVWGIVKFSAGA
jgi:hypothetical protein